MASNDANLEFKIRADASQGQGELRQFRAQVGSDLNVIKGNFGGTGAAIKQEMAGVAQSLSAGTGAVGQFAGAFGAAGLTVGAGIGAYVALGSAIYDLSNKAAEAGERFDDFATKTGLSVETASGLELSLKQNETSLAGLANGMFFLTKNQAAARAGSDELAEAFRKLGVDLHAGPEEAIRQLVAGLTRVEDVGERNRLGALALGRGYKELSLFINSTNGDLDKLIEQSRKAGRVMTEEATKAAAQYKDNLDELNAQLDAVQRNLGNDFVPGVSRAMKTISDLLAGNTISWQQWAFNVKDAFEMANPGIRGIGAETLGFAVGGFTGMGAVSDARMAARRAEAERLARKENEGRSPGGVRIPEEFQYKPRISDEELLRASKGRMEKAREDDERDAARKREDARKEEQRQIERAEDAKRDAYRKTIKTVQGWEKDVQREIEAAKKENARIDREMSNMRADASDAVRQAIRREVAELTNENAHLNEINNTIKRAEILGAIDARTAAWLRTLAVLNDVSKELEKIGITEDSLAGLGDLNKPIPYGKGGGKGPFVDPEEFEAQFGKPPDFSAWELAISDLRETAVDAFASIGDAVGQAIEGWLLYGGSIGQAMRQATAAVLAGIAAQAAVKAIFQLAEGFAALLFNPAAAALHFKSAALYGAAAVAAGIGARVAAGSAFSGAGAQGGSAFGGGGESGRPNDQKFNYGGHFSTPASEETGGGSRYQGSGLMGGVLAPVLNKIDATLSRLQSMPAGHVVTMGATDAREAIGVAVLQQSGSDDSFNDRLARNMRVA